MKKIKAVLLLWALFITISISCTHDWKDVETKDAFSTTKYKIIQIEDMPCVIIDGLYEGGISCDWSKWR